MECFKTNLRLPVNYDLTQRTPSTALSVTTSKESPSNSSNLRRLAANGNVPLSLLANVSGQKIRVAQPEVNTKGSLEVPVAQLTANVNGGQHLRVNTRGSHVPEAQLLVHGSAGQVSATQLAPNGGHHPLPGNEQQSKKHNGAVSKSSVYLGRPILGRGYYLNANMPYSEEPLPHTLVHQLPLLDRKPYGHDDHGDVTSVLSLKPQAPPLYKDILCNSTGGGREDGKNAATPAGAVSPWPPHLNAIRQPAISERDMLILFNSGLTLNQIAARLEALADCNKPVGKGTEPDKDCSRPEVSHLAAARRAPLDLVGFQPNHAVQDTSSGQGATNEQPSDIQGSDQYKATLSVLPSNVAPCYSRKVFIGGLPQDMTIDMIADHFVRYGAVTVSWPHQEENNNTLIFPPKGFVFLRFKTMESVRHLVSECQYILGGGYYTILSSPNSTKPVQVRAWASADAECVINPAGMHPRNTIFVGGVPRPLTASKLAEIMSIYGPVCYVGIDVDQELGYPKGSGRVVFSERNSCIAAISTRFIQITVDNVPKKLEMKAYILTEQLCDMCNGKLSNYQPAKHYCAHVGCMMYLCSYCWCTEHRKPGKSFHKPQNQKSSNYQNV